MYTSHFGLTETPFSITPDPRYLFMSERHREGLAHLLYGIRQPGGFVQLTGEVGTGKTTLCRCLLRQLPPDVDVALILNPRLTTLEFLATLCDELRIAYPAATRSVKVLVDALYGYLLDAHGRGRRTVLIIDEAQNLPADVLEQIRLLTNLETATEKLLQIVLIGQPELITLLQRRKLRQLAQRITARYHLLELSRDETCAYIRHRVRVAGGSDALFTPAALRLAHRLSGGVPRLINVVCDRALLGAYANDQRRIEAATVRRAGREVGGAGRRGWKPSRLAWAFGLGAVGVAVVGAAVLGLPGYVSISRRDVAPVAASADVNPAAEDRQSPQKSSPSPARPEDPAAPAVAGGPAPASGRLADLLADPAVRSNDHAAFASVYSRWALEYQSTPGGPGCEPGRGGELDCLFQAGSWSLFKDGTWDRLRRFDLPAILELATPTGERHRVALVALAEESATLVLGEREHTFPLGEIDRLWDGTFLLLWKAPPIGSRLISPGMRGKDVEWLRARLDALEGKVATGPRRDVYDEELRQRVLAFQRSWSLIPDGLVGEETLTQLTLASREPGTPSLSRRTP